MRVWLLLRMSLFWENSTKWYNLLSAVTIAELLTLSQHPGVKILCSALTASR